MINGLRLSYEIAVRWISLDLYDSNKSILVQVMVWCRQATSHHLNQCWPGSMTPYVITRPQWVKFIYTTNPSLPFDEGPAAVTMLFEIKCSRSPSDSSTILPLILCWFYQGHFEMWIFHYREADSANIVVTRQLLYTLSLNIKYVFFTRLPTYVATPKSKC